MFACDHFEAYIYGRDNIHVDTDHKPQEGILLKPLNSAHKRLQRMLLTQQNYSLQVKYKKGVKMFLADTLSRPTDHTRSLTLMISIFYKLKTCLLMILCYKCYTTILCGWPESKSDVPDSILYMHILTSKMI